MIITIIGAGPVGMNFALQVLRRYPDTQIIFFDKRNTYKRHQIITLYVDDIYGYPTSIVKEIDYVSCRGANSNEYNLEIRLFEIILRNYLQEIPNVYFVRCNIASVNNNQVRCTNGEVYDYDMLIGADGSNSMVRKTFFNKKDMKYLYKKPFYAMSIFFTGEMSNECKAYKNLKYNDSRFLKTSYGIFSLSFSINESIYNKYKNKSVNKIPSEFQERMNELSKIAEFKFTGFVDLLVVKINPYIMNTVAKDNVFLIGDSAMTTHYFTGTGLRNGFTLSSVLLDNIDNPVCAMNEFVKCYKIKLRQSINEALAAISIPVCDPTVFNNGVCGARIKNMYKTPIRWSPKRKINLLKKQMSRQTSRRRRRSR